MANILITGGSGRLGRGLRKAMPDAAFPTHSELDILDPDACHQWIRVTQPRLVIHCAGYVNALKAEYERTLCWNVNFQGTRNMAKASSMARFVYISTDYVFDGVDGNYSEDAIPRPINEYGSSKVAAEEAVLMDHPSALVLRIPFRYGPPWPYAAAFTDQWTSARFIPEVVPDIFRSADMDITGVLHIGGSCRRIYDMAYEVSPTVGKLLRKDALVPLPRDVSLNSSRWLSLSRR